MNARRITHSLFYFFSLRATFGRLPANLLGPRTPELTLNTGARPARFVTLQSTDWMISTLLRGQIYTTPPTPENSWRVAFQGLFFASRTTFSHLSGFFFFCASFFHKKTRVFFLKSHRFCRTESLRKQNCACHSRFSMVPKISDCTYFKAYERKWQCSPVKTRECFLMS